MINIDIIILFIEFITYILGQTLIWNFENTTINLLSSDLYENIIYDETKNGYRLKLEKYINKTNEKIIHNNYIKVNNDDKIKVDWEDIYNFFPIKNKLFICPKGSNYLYDYSSSGININIYPKDGIKGDWELTCFNYKERILISYLGSDNTNIYTLNIENGEWESFQMNIIYLDILWPDREINGDNFYTNAIILDSLNIFLRNINITMRDISSSNFEGDEFYINYGQDIRNAFFDENKHFYWITYVINNLDHFQSGYSKTSIPDNIDKFNNYFDNPIETKNNFNSPFDIKGNIQINYIKLFKNTKYAYYKLTENELSYHGIIDIELNQIIFNTNKIIIEFKPYSKFSFLANTSSSVYEICLYGKLDKKCIDKCLPGQELIIDNEKGNYCNGTEKCEKYILKPNSICVEFCDKSIYTLIGEKECGLCKYLNKSFPYKIEGEDSCIKEKPKNTFFIDESSYILKKCHSSCETCNGENDNQCLSCKNSILFEGKCINECPDRYYKDSKINQCLKCNSNCLTCSEGIENNNNHCTSCPNNNYLITAEGMDNNCVDKCPNNTVINSSTWECQDEINNKNDNGDYNDGNNDKKTKNENSKMIIWILVVVIILLIVIIIVILLRKLSSNPKEDDINVVLKSEEDNFILQRNNDSYSQETEN